MSVGDAMAGCFVVGLVGAILAVAASQLTKGRWLKIAGITWFLFWAFPGLSHLWLTAVLA